MPLVFVGTLRYSYHTRSLERRHESQELIESHEQSQEAEVEDVFHPDEEDSKGSVLVKDTLLAHPGVDEDVKSDLVVVHPAADVEDKDHPAHHLAVVEEVYLDHPVDHLAHHLAVVGRLPDLLEEAEDLDPPGDPLEGVGEEAYRMLFSVEHRVA
jgi:hypothetical protein